MCGNHPYRYSCQITEKKAIELETFNASHFEKTRRKGDGEMTCFTVKKSKMERYDIRINGEEGWRCTWATISISDDGFFNAQTDCGDFSYRWGSFGDCFKSFLIGMDKGDYLYGKISNNEEQVDAEETIKQIKVSLLERRKQEEIDKNDATLAWEEIGELIDDCDGQSPETFYFAVSSKYWINEAIPDLFDGLDVSYKPDYVAKAFCEVVMPVFVEILKKELAEKKTT